MSDKRATLRNILCYNATLMGLIGGPAHVVASYTQADAEIPVVSIELAGEDDRDTHAPDKTDTYEISVWDDDIERIDRVCEIIRSLLHGKPVNGLHSFLLVLESGEEYLPDVEAFVRTMQFNARYAQEV